MTMKPKLNPARRRIAIVVCLILGVVLWRSLRCTDAALRLTHSDRVQGLQRKGSGRSVKACFFVLMDRSQEFDMAETLHSFEERFNGRFHYSWVFVSDDPLTTQFKEMATAISSGSASFEQVDRPDWRFPSTVDAEDAQGWRATMESLKLSFTGKDDIQQRHAHRFMSGRFQHHPSLKDYDWVWRVTPGSRLTCDVDYDVFKTMADQGKMYAFIMAQHVDERRSPSLFELSLEYSQSHPGLPQSRLRNFIDMDTEALKGDRPKRPELGPCEFWPSFEVMSLKWLRSSEYMDFFQALDSHGGFYLESWTDGVFRTYAAALLLSLDQLLWLSDIGYSYQAQVCPTDKQSRLEKKCTCNKDVSVTWNPQKYCMHKYFIYTMLARPDDWEDHLNRNL